MGFSASVEVEGEELEGPIAERTDGKGLADFVIALWIHEPPERLQGWGLPVWVAEVFRTVDANAYGDDGDDAAKEVWMDPARLKAALHAMRMWRAQTVRGNRRLQREIDDHHLKDEWFEGQDAGLEDGIARCDWAIAHGRRVKIVVW